MPPQRLGQATWRDRISRHGVQRVTSGWSRRFGAAATTAIAATVILAFGAVWLTQPGRGPTTGQVATPLPSAISTPYNPYPDGTPTPSPRASEGPSPSPLPTRAVTGDPLPISSLVVQSEQYQAIDLTTGQMSGPLGNPWQGDRLVPRGKGGWTCICTTYPGGWGTSTSVSVELVDYDADGELAGRRFLGTYDGAIGDPQVEYFWSPASAQATRSSRPDRAYIGWTLRLADGWQSGVDVVDLGAGTVVEKIHLPEYPLVDGNDAGGKPILTLAQPPTVRVSPSGTRLVVRQERGVIAHNAYGVATDATWSRTGHWAATIDGDRVSEPAAMADGEGSLDARYCPLPIDEGFASEDVYAAVCPSAGVVRRVDLAGQPLGDVAVPDLSSGLATAVSAPDGSRYVWLPFTRTLTKVDPIAGRVVATTKISAPTAASADGPLDGLASLGRQLGRWLAPTTTAKVYLEPAMAISPDGSRLYVLGIDAESFSDGDAGSTGIHVVDTTDMTEVATWPPVADYVSIAVSGDGSIVYALSGPRYSDSGASVLKASLTAIDSGTGTVRLVEGQLEADYISFDPALVP